MDKIKAVLSGNKTDETTNTSGTTGTTGHHPSSGLTGEGSHLGQSTGAGFGHTSGPHSTETANRLDPNVPLGSGAGEAGLGGGNTTSHGIGSSTTTTAGPHSSNLANKADPRVDSDRDGSNLGSSTTTSHGVGGTGIGGSTHTTAGPHSSGLANKADPRVDSDRDGSHLGSSTTTGLGGTTATSHQGVGGTGIGSSTTTTAGPHSSDLANKADPRVDSDRDGSHLGSGTTSGLGGNTTTTHQGVGGTGLGSSNTTTTAGPHSSNLANKADPRVDSDRDGSHLGSGTTTGFGGTTGHQGVGGTGLGSSNTTSTAGPHSSNLANKADPRVDSDRDGSHLGSGTTTGLGGTTTTAHHGVGGTGLGSSNTTTTAGPHSSDVANKADPRVDSDRDGSHHLASGAAAGGIAGAAASHHHGSSNTQSTTGHATTTAGPHSSDLANKADPRVDSDNSKATHHDHHKHDHTTHEHAKHEKHDKHEKHEKHEHATHDHSKHDPSSHTGRDVAAGAGAAGVAEHEHHKHESATKNVGDLPGPAPNTAGPHKHDWLNKLDPRVDATGTKHKDHTTTEHSKDHPAHSSGPAALGGPAVTATAPSHNTHVGARDQSKDPLTSEQLGVGNVPAGTQKGALGGFGAEPTLAHGDKHHTTGTEHATGEHAVGSEHHRTTGATPLTAKPVGTDIGDKLHGVERNRGAGVAGVGAEHSTHTGHAHTAGEHTTTGVAGTHSHTAGEHTTSGATGTHGHHTTGEHTAAGTAAGAAATHEAGSHHIGGGNASHVGHGHTTDEKTNLAERTNEQSTTSGTHESTNLPGTNPENKVTDPNAPEGYDEASQIRRGTTSGVHTDPAIHHVPAVGHKTDV